MSPCVTRPYRTPGTTRRLPLRQSRKRLSGGDPADPFGEPGIEGRQPGNRDWSPANRPHLTRFNPSLIFNVAGVPSGSCHTLVPNAPGNRATREAPFRDRAQRPQSSLPAQKPDPGTRRVGGGVVKDDHRNHGVLVRLSAARGVPTRRDPSPRRRIPGSTGGRRWATSRSSSAHWERRLENTLTRRGQVQAVPAPGVLGGDRARPRRRAELHARSRECPAEGKGYNAANTFSHGSAAGLRPASTPSASSTTRSSTAS